MKGNMWRLIWNYLCLGGTIFVVFFAAFCVALFIFFHTTSAKADSVVFVGGISLLVALFEATNLALTCIYVCTACRILIEEKKALL